VVKKLKEHIDKQRNELVGYDKLKSGIDKSLGELNGLCGLAEVIEGRVDVEEYINKDVQLHECLSRLLW